MGRAGLSICLLSLLGFPGTFGFIGKWYLIVAAVAEGQYILPVVLGLGSLVSAGYYLPVIMAMTMKPTRLARGAPAGALLLGRPRRPWRSRWP